MIDEIELTAPLRPVIRVATEEDRQTVEANREKEKKAFSICQQKIAEHGLDMKLVKAEYSFDGSKVLFFFTSEGRVDFRRWSRTWPGPSTPVSSCARSACRDEAKDAGWIRHLWKALLLLPIFG